MAPRINALNEEAVAHEATLRAIVTSWCPDLLELTGVGPIVAATSCAPGPIPPLPQRRRLRQPRRRRTPPSLPGKHIVHRLNRGGDRQLNRALHVIALSRFRYDPTTRAYAQRRRTEANMSDRAIRRCLKRYIARQLYRQPEAGPAPT